jgi:hypothetical protein
MIEVVLNGQKWFYKLTWILDTEGQVQAGSEPEKNAEA